MALRRPPKTPPQQEGQQQEQPTQQELAGPKKLEEILKKVDETRKKLKSGGPVDYNAEYDSLSSYHGELGKITAGAGKHLLFTTAEVAYKAGKKDDARELFKQLDSPQYDLTDRERGMVLKGVFKTSGETNKHEDQLAAGRALLKDAGKRGLSQEDRKNLLQGVLSAAAKTKDYDLKVEAYSELHHNAADYDLTARDKNIVHERLGDAYHKKGQHREALREYGKLYSNVDVTQDKEEGQDRFFEYRHGAQDKRGDKELETEFTQRRSEIKRKIGSCHMGLKNWGQAEKNYKESLEINGNNLEAKNGLGAAQFNLGKQAKDMKERAQYYRKAHQNFDEVAKETSEDSRLHRSAVNNRGVINYWMGHRVEAETDLITASQADPNHKVFGLNRASYLYHERRIGESRQELERVEQITPEQESSKSYDSRVEKLREKTTKELRGKTTDKAQQKAEAEGEKLAQDVWRKITSPHDLREKRETQDGAQVAEEFVKHKQGIREHALKGIHERISKNEDLTDTDPKKLKVRDVDNLGRFLAGTYEGVRRSEKLGIQVEQDTIVESHNQLMGLSHFGEAEKQVKDAAAELKKKQEEEQKKIAQEREKAQETTKQKPKAEAKADYSKKGEEIVDSLCPTEGEPKLTPAVAAEKFKDVYDANPDQGSRMVEGMVKRVGELGLDETEETKINDTLARINQHAGKTLKIREGLVQAYIKANQQMEGDMPVSLDKKEAEKQLDELTQKLPAKEDKPAEDPPTEGKPKGGGPASKEGETSEDKAAEKDNQPKTKEGRKDAKKPPEGKTVNKITPDSTGEVDPSQVFEEGEDQVTGEPKTPETPQLTAAPQGQEFDFQGRKISTLKEFAQELGGDQGERLFGQQVRTGNLSNWVRDTLKSGDKASGIDQIRMDNQLTEEQRMEKIRRLLEE